jgi:hypothetical protein
VERDPVRAEARRYRYVGLDAELSHACDDRVLKR